ncbi:hypothetical protein Ef22C036LT_42550 (plasmid) [Escherichia fergusonii]|nr:hypothetical protein Ef22C036LT_42550 [Escherichia fergusonii]
MNQTLPTADLNTAGTTDVIPSVAIDRIIAQRNEGIALFMQAMECLATARKILLDASGDIFLYGFEDCVTDSVRRMDKPEEAKRNITRPADRKIWDRLMTDTGMYTFMSSCQRDEWNSQLMSDTCPEITLDNVLATFRYLNASKMQTFEQGLIDVYRKLSWDYRTNNPCRLGKKIIIENLLYRWSNGRVTLDCSGREALDDLVRPFYLLEGATFLTSGTASGRSMVNFSGTAIMSVSCQKGNILRCVATRKGPYTLSLSVLTLLKN